MNRTIFVAILSIAFAGCLFSQAPANDPQPSLADVARQIRAQKKSSVKARAVITEDTIAASKGPIPELRLDSVDNSKDVVASIELFKATHTVQQTEAAVREWYDSEDSQLAYEYSQVAQQQSNWTSPYGTQDRPPTTYQQSQERMLAQSRAYEVSRRSAAASAEVRQHLQTRLATVRTGVRAMGLNYDWFKIRCSNSDCSY